MKHCPKCGRLLPDDSFYPNKGSGLQSWCKDCFRERKAKMIKTTPRGPRQPAPQKELLYDYYIVQGLTQEEVALRLGISTFRVWFWLNKFGIPRRTSLESRELSIQNGRKMPLKGRKRGPLAESTKEMIRIKAFARNAHTPGYRKTSNGYYEYTRGPHKGRLIHDVIMESVIGRSLLPNEVVHHINGIRTDNRRENLLLMTRGEHARLHQNQKTNQPKQ